MNDNYDSTCIKNDVCDMAVCDFQECRHRKDSDDRYKKLYEAEKARREAAEKALNTAHKYEEGKSTINGIDVDAWIKWQDEILAHEKVMKEEGE